MPLCMVFASSDLCLHTTTAFELFVWRAADPIADTIFLDGCCYSSLLLHTIRAIDPPRFQIQVQLTVKPLSSSCGHRFCTIRTDQLLIYWTGSRSRIKNLALLSRPAQHSQHTHTTTQKTRGAPARRRGRTTRTPTPRAVVDEDEEETTTWDHPENGDDDDDTRSGSTMSVLDAVDQARLWAAMGRRTTIAAPAALLEGAGYHRHHHHRRRSSSLAVTARPNSLYFRRRSNTAAAFRRESMPRLSVLGMDYHEHAASARARSGDPHAPVRH